MLSELQSKIDSLQSELDSVKVSDIYMLPLLLSPFLSYHVLPFIMVNVNMYSSYKRNCQFSCIFAEYEKLTNLQNYNLH